MAKNTHQTAPKGALICGTLNTCRNYIKNEYESRISPEQMRECLDPLEDSIVNVAIVEAGFDDQAAKDLLEEVGYDGETF